MGSASQYCLQRKDLENAAWSLATLSEIMLCYGAFLRQSDFEQLKSTQSECAEARAELSEARYRLNRTEQITDVSNAILGRCAPTRVVFTAFRNRGSQNPAAGLLHRR